MSVHRSLVVMVVAGLSTVACSDERLRVPSDPASWDRQALGLPTASARCPGGEIRVLRDADPQMRPMTPAAYAETHPQAFHRLRGVRRTDALYPYYLRHDLADGSFTGVGGFILARDGCIIHVEANEFDN